MVDTYVVRESSRTEECFPRSDESSNALVVQKVGSRSSSTFIANVEEQDERRGAVRLVVDAMYAVPSRNATLNCALGAKAPASETPSPRFRRCTKPPASVPSLDSTREWLAPHPMAATVSLCCGLPESESLSDGPARFLWQLLSC